MPESRARYSTPLLIVLLILSALAGGVVARLLPLGGNEPPAPRLLHVRLEDLRRVPCLLRPRRAGREREHDSDDPHAAPARRQTARGSPMLPFSGHVRMVHS